MELDLRAVVWLLWKPHLRQKPRKESGRHGGARPGTPLVGRSSEVALFDLRCALGESKSSLLTGSDGRMVDEHARLLLHSALRELPHTAGRGAYHQIGRRMFGRIYGVDLEAADSNR